MAEFNIELTRHNKYYTCTGSCMLREDKPKRIKILRSLFQWILNKHNNQNFKIAIENTNLKIYSAICSFCNSNDLDYRYPIRIFAYVKDNRNYFGIEQGTFDNVITLNKSTFSDITLENILEKARIYKMTQKQHELQHHNHESSL